jgi:hypothetical protein
LLSALVVGNAELLAGSNELDLVLNGLVSSISGIIYTTGSSSSHAVVTDDLRKLTALNTMSEVDETFWSRVKEFRIVMLVKTVLDWPNAVADSSASWITSTEMLRLMRSLLVWIKHIDGDFWEKMIILLQDALEVVLISAFLIF